MRAPAGKINNRWNFNGLCCDIEAFIPWSHSFLWAPPASITLGRFGHLRICKHHTLSGLWSVSGRQDPQTAARAGLNLSKTYFRCVALVLFPQIREEGPHFWGMLDQLADKRGGLKLADCVPTCLDRDRGGSPGDSEGNCGLCATCQQTLLLSLLFSAYFEWEDVGRTRRRDTLIKHVALGEWIWIWVEWFKKRFGSQIFRAMTDSGKRHICVSVWPEM